MTRGEETDDPCQDTVRVAFVCVRNAGRSQMATVFAERERERRGLTDRVGIETGGTDPATEVHDVVVEVMAEEGIDIAGRTPRDISTGTLEACDYVATMGCSTLDLDAGGVDVRDWALEDPHGATLETAREIQGEVRRRVRDLFDEIEADVAASGG